MRIPRPEVRVQRLGQVLEGSAAHAQVKFRKVPVQRLGEAPKGLVQIVGEALEGSGRYLGEVPEGAGQMRWSGSGRFRCRG